MSFLIRVQLPDKPGALGAVATALGGIGADILSVDVVERAVHFGVGISRIGGDCVTSSPVVALTSST